MSYLSKHIGFGVFMVSILMIMACGQKHGSPADGAADTHSDVPFVGAAWVDTPRSSARFFISGHSLVDQPLPNYLAEIARSLDTPTEWERQYVVGSAIVRRTRGEDASSDGWVGYRQGYNRSGQDLNVIGEFLSPQSIQGGKYDVLLITEEHSMLDGLVSNDTVRYLRHFHDRFIEGNADGTTYFYESWISLGDKSDPRRWIEYERAASPVWQCMATRINLSLAAEGRADRIISLPAGAALAELIYSATQGSGLSGISLGNTRKTVDSIVGDDVHLTSLGNYYMALVTYAAVYRRPPAGAWAPAGVSEVQANMLQKVAWEFVSNYYKSYRPLSMKECRERLRNEMIGIYLAYFRDTFWSNELSLLHAYLRWGRRLATWHYTFSRNDSANPFHFDMETDKDYWFPGP